MSKSDAERIAHLETSVDQIKSVQKSQQDDLEEIKQGIHSLNGFKEFREEHEEMYDTYSTKTRIRTGLWEIVKVGSGGGVLAVLVNMVI